VGVLVCVGVFVIVGVLVGVRVGVLVGVFVAVLVGVGVNCETLKSTTVIAGRHAETFALMIVGNPATAV
jgi:hypothetical protein